MQKAKEQLFDRVHDTQEIYRHLLDCMARPGKIKSIEKNVGEIEVVQGISQSLLGLAYTLVDREVSFHVISANQAMVAKHLNRKTFSPAVRLHDADFLLIEKDLSNEEIQGVMDGVRIGTLEDPHLSTTLLITVDRLSEEEECGIKLRLKGPGIQHEKTMYLDGLSVQWLMERKRVNQEFPLGIDMILATKSGQVMALPRTTIVESEGV